MCDFLTSFDMHRMCMLVFDLFIYLLFIFSGGMDFVGFDSGF